MEGKSNINNSNQSKLLVDFFETQGEEVVCYTYEEGTEKEETKTITVAEFEKWLEDNEYLKGTGEDCTGADHNGEPVFVTSKWDFTIEEILEGSSDWSASELLADFINQQTVLA